MHVYIIYIYIQKLLVNIFSEGINFVYLYNYRTTFIKICLFQKIQKNILYIYAVYITYTYIRIICTYILKT